MDNYVLDVVPYCNLMDNDVPDLAPHCDLMDIDVKGSNSSLP